jgi:hypothetical protein
MQNRVRHIFSHQTPHLAHEFATAASKSRASYEAEKIRSESLANEISTLREQLREIDTQKQTISLLVAEKASLIKSLEHLDGVQAGASTHR